MPFIKTTVDKVPKRSRVRIPRFEKTSEWAEMKAALERGLLPTEALVVTLNPEDMQEYRISNRRTVSRFVQKYLSAHNLPYKLTSRQIGGGGFLVMVSN
jgi:hypothetical protein